MLVCPFFDMQASLFISCGLQLYCRIWFMVEPNLRFALMINMFMLQLACITCGLLFCTGAFRDAAAASPESSSQAAT